MQEMVPYPTFYYWEENPHDKCKAKQNNIPVVHTTFPLENWREAKIYRLNQNLNLGWPLYFIICAEYYYYLH